MRAFIKRSKDNQFYFTIVAKNGETIVHSETYTRKENAEHAIRLLEGTEYHIVDKTRLKEDE